MPGIHTPVIDTKPGGDRPGSDRPGTERPGTDTPVIDTKPGSDRPGGDRPGSDRPGTERPGTDTPVIDTKPGGDRPGSDRPGTERPGTDTPVIDTKPGTDKPGTEQPGGDKPGTTPTLPPLVAPPAPVGQQPVGQQPVRTTPTPTQTPITSQPSPNTPSPNTPSPNTPSPNTPSPNTPIAAPVTAPVLPPPNTTPVTDTPTIDAPVTTTPVTTTPVTTTPVTDIPDLDTPPATPVTNTPVTNTPVTNTPVTNTPVTNTPVTNTPVTNTNPTGQTNPARTDTSTPATPTPQRPQESNGTTPPTNFQATPAPFVVGDNVQVQPVHAPEASTRTGPATEQSTEDYGDREDAVRRDAQTEVHSEVPVRERLPLKREFDGPAESAFGSTSPATNPPDQDTRPAAMSDKGKQRATTPNLAPAEPDTSGIDDELSDDMPLFGFPSEPPAGLDAATQGWADQVRQAHRELRDAEPRKREEVLRRAQQLAPLPPGNIFIGKDSQTPHQIDTENKIDQIRTVVAHTLLTTDSDTTAANQATQLTKQFGVQRRRGLLGGHNPAGSSRTAGESSTTATTATNRAVAVPTPKITSSEPYIADSLKRASFLDERRLRTRVEQFEQLARESGFNLIHEPVETNTQEVLSELGTRWQIFLLEASPSPASVARIQELFTDLYTTSTLTLRRFPRTRQKYIASEFPAVPQEKSTQQFSSIERALYRRTIMTMLDNPGILIHHLESPDGAPLHERLIRSRLMIISIQSASQVIGSPRYNLILQDPTQLDHLLNPYGAPADSAPNFIYEVENAKAPLTYFEQVPHSVMHLVKFDGRSTSLSPQQEQDLARALREIVAELEMRSSLGEQTPANIVITSEVPQFLDHTDNSGNANNKTKTEQERQLHETIKRHIRKEASELSDPYRKNSLAKLQTVASPLPGRGDTPGEIGIYVSIGNGETERAADAYLRLTGELDNVRLRSRQDLFDIVSNQLNQHAIREFASSHGYYDRSRIRFKHRPLGPTARTRLADIDEALQRNPATPEVDHLIRPVLATLVLSASLTLTAPNPTYDPITPAFLNELLGEVTRFLSSNPSSSLFDSLESPLYGLSTAHNTRTPMLQFLIGLANLDNSDRTLMLERVKRGDIEREIWNIMQRPLLHRPSADYPFKFFYSSTLREIRELTYEFPRSSFIFHGPSEDETLSDKERAQLHQFAKSHAPEVARLAERRSRPREIMIYVNSSANSDLGEDFLDFGWPAQMKETLVYHLEREFSSFREKDPTLPNIFFDVRVRNSGSVGRGFAYIEVHTEAVGLTPEQLGIDTHLRATRHLKALAIPISELRTLATEYSSLMQSTRWKVEVQNHTITFGSGLLGISDTEELLDTLNRGLIDFGDDQIVSQVRSLVADLIMFDSLHYRAFPAFHNGIHHRGGWQLPAPSRDDVNRILEDVIAFLFHSDHRKLFTDPNSPAFGMRSDPGTPLPVRLLRISLMYLSPEEKTKLLAHWQHFAELTQKDNLAHRIMVRFDMTSGHYGAHLKEDLRTLYFSKIGGPPPGVDRFAGRQRLSIVTNSAGEMVLRGYQSNNWPALGFSPDQLPLELQTQPEFQVRFTLDEPHSHSRVRLADAPAQQLAHPTHSSTAPSFEVRRVGEGPGGVVEITVVAAFAASHLDDRAVRNTIAQAQHSIDMYYNRAALQLPTGELLRFRLVPPPPLVRAHHTIALGPDLDPGYLRWNPRQSHAVTAYSYGLMIGLHDPDTADHEAEIERLAAHGPTAEHVTTLQDALRPRPEPSDTLSSRAKGKNRDDDDVFMEDVDADPDDGSAQRSHTGFRTSSSPNFGDRDLRDLLDWADRIERAQAVLDEVPRGQRRQAEKLARQLVPLPTALPLEQTPDQARTEWLISNIRLVVTAALLDLRTREADRETHATALAKELTKKYSVRRTRGLPGGAAPSTIPNPDHGETSVAGAARTIDSPAHGFSAEPPAGLDAADPHWADQVRQAHRALNEADPAEVDHALRRAQQLAPLPEGTIFIGRNTQTPQQINIQNKIDQIRIVVAHTLLTDSDTTAANQARQLTRQFGVQRRQGLPGGHKHVYDPNPDTPTVGESSATAAARPAPRPVPNPPATPPPNAAFDSADYIRTAVSAAPFLNERKLRERIRQYERLAHESGFELKSVITPASTDAALEIITTEWPSFSRGNTDSPPEVARTQSLLLDLYTTLTLELRRPANSPHKSDRSHFSHIRPFTANSIFIAIGKAIGQGSITPLLDDPNSTTHHLESTKNAPLHERLVRSRLLFLNQHNRDLVAASPRFGLLLQEPAMLDRLLHPAREVWNSAQIIVNETTNTNNPLTYFQAITHSPTRVIELDKKSRKISADQDRKLAAAVSSMVAEVDARSKLGEGTPAEIVITATERKRPERSLGSTFLHSDLSQAQTAHLHKRASEHLITALSNLDKPAPRTRSLDIRIVKSEPNPQQRHQNDRTTFGITLSIGNIDFERATDAYLRVTSSLENVQLTDRRSLSDIVDNQLNLLNIHIPGFSARYAYRPLSPETRTRLELLNEALRTNPALATDNHAVRSVIANLLISASLILTSSDRQIDPITPARLNEVLEEATRFLQDHPSSELFAAHDSPLFSLSSVHYAPAPMLYLFVGLVNLENRNRALILKRIGDDDVQRELNNIVPAMLLRAGSPDQPFKRVYSDMLLEMLEVPSNLPRSFTMPVAANPKVLSEDERSVLRIFARNFAPEAARRALEGIPLPKVNIVFDSPIAFGPDGRPLPRPKMEWQFIARDALYSYLAQEFTKLRQANPKLPEITIIPPIYSSENGTPGSTRFVVVVKPSGITPEQCAVDTHRLVTRNLRNLTVPPSELRRTVAEFSDLTNSARWLDEHKQPDFQFDGDILRWTPTYLPSARIEGLLDSLNNLLGSFADDVASDTRTLVRDLIIASSIRYWSYPVDRSSRYPVNAEYLLSPITLTEVDKILGEMVDFLAKNDHRRLFTDPLSPVFGMRSEHGDPLATRLFRMATVHLTTEERGKLYENWPRFARTSRSDNLILKLMAPGGHYRTVSRENVRATLHELYFPGVPQPRFENEEMPAPLYSTDLPPAYQHTSWPVLGFSPDQLPLELQTQPEFQVRFTEPHNYTRDRLTHTPAQQHPHPTLPSTTPAFETRHAGHGPGSVLEITVLAHFTTNPDTDPDPDPDTLRTTINQAQHIVDMYYNRATLQLPTGELLRFRLIPTPPDQAHHTISLEPGDEPSHLHWDPAQPHAITAYSYGLMIGIFTPHTTNHTTEIHHLTHHGLTTHHLPAIQHALQPPTTPTPRTKGKQRATDDTTTSPDNAGPGPNSQDQEWNERIALAELSLSWAAPQEREHVEDRARQLVPLPSVTPLAPSAELASTEQVISNIRLVVAAALLHDLSQNMSDPESNARTLAGELTTRFGVHRTHGFLGGLASPTRPDFRDGEASTSGATGETAARSTEFGQAPAPGVPAEPPAGLDAADPHWADQVRQAHRALNEADPAEVDHALRRAQQLAPLPEGTIFIGRNTQTPQQINIQNKIDQIRIVVAHTLLTDSDTTAANQARQLTRQFGVQRRQGLPGGHKHTSNPDTLDGPTTGESSASAAARPDPRPAPNSSPNPPRNAAFDSADYIRTAVSAAPFLNERKLRERIRQYERLAHESGFELRAVDIPTSTKAALHTITTGWRSFSRDGSISPADVARTQSLLLDLFTTSTLELRRPANSPQKSSRSSFAHIPSTISNKIFTTFGQAVGGKSITSLLDSPNSVTYHLTPEDDAPLHERLVRSRLLLLDRAVLKQVVTSPRFLLLLQDPAMLDHLLHPARQVMESAALLAEQTTNPKKPLTFFEAISHSPRHAIDLDKKARKLSTTQDRQLAAAIGDMVAEIDARSALGEDTPAEIVFTATDPMEFGRSFRSSLLRTGDVQSKTSPLHMRIYEHIVAAQAGLSAPAPRTLSLDVRVTNAAPTVHQKRQGNKLAFEITLSVGNDSVERAMDAYLRLTGPLENLRLTSRRALFDISRNQLNLQQIRLPGFSSARYTYRPLSQETGARLSLFDKALREDATPVAVDNLVRSVMANLIVSASLIITSRGRKIDPITPARLDEILEEATLFLSKRSSSDLFTSFASPLYGLSSAHDEAAPMLYLLVGLVNLDNKQRDLVLKRLDSADIEREIQNVLPIMLFQGDSSNRPFRRVYGHMLNEMTGVPSRLPRSFTMSPGVSRREELSKEEHEVLRRFARDFAPGAAQRAAEGSTLPDIKIRFRTSDRTSIHLLDESRSMWPHNARDALESYFTLEFDKLRQAKPNLPEIIISPSVYYQSSGTPGTAHFEIVAEPTGITPEQRAVDAHVLATRRLDTLMLPVADLHRTAAEFSELTTSARWRHEHSEPEIQFDETLLEMPRTEGNLNALHDLITRFDDIADDVRTFVGDLVIAASLRYMNHPLGDPTDPFSARTYVLAPVTATKVDKILGELVDYLAENDHRKLFTDPISPVFGMRSEPGTPLGARLFRIGTVHLTDSEKKKLFDSWSRFTRMSLSDDLVLKLMVPVGRYNLASEETTRASLYEVYFPGVSLPSSNYDSDATPPAPLYVSNGPSGVFPPGYQVDDWPVLGFSPDQLPLELQTQPEFQVRFTEPHNYNRDRLTHTPAQQHPHPTLPSTTPAFETRHAGHGPGSVLEITVLAHFT
ncbi:hypothetical protein PV646_44630, partial [Streptomyces sp. ID05-26A]|nr:hypothetical protein [Streptomyces sp. ID05-26A]